MLNSLELTIATAIIFVFLMACPISLLIAEYKFRKIER